MADRSPLRASAVGTLAAFLAALVLAADQLSKLAVIRTLPAETPVPILGDFLIFYYVRNPGAAFSLGESVTWLFTIALAAVSVVIGWLLVTRVRSRVWAVTLGLLLGGVLGNLGDRLFRDPGFPVGHVVDFISTPWMMPAIYNIADMFIVCGMITVAILVLIGIGWDGRREQRADTAEKQAAQEQAADHTAAPADAAPAAAEQDAAEGDASTPDDSRAR